LDLGTLVASNSTLTGANYLNGADELTENIATFDMSGNPIHGHMSGYRTAWKDNTGFILRNDGVGPFFRIKSFYKTEGVVSMPFQNIKKLPDMTGSAKIEGQLVPLSTGVFFFNNSGAISVFNETSGVWETGGTGVNSEAFRSLQDTSVIGYDEPENTLLATSDGDRKAYLSYDYSTKAFIKFNEIDLTFSSISNRPSGDQWQMRIF
jgi:hypothetical protein